MALRRRRYTASLRRRGRSPRARQLNYRRFDHRDAVRRPDEIAVIIKRTTEPGRHVGHAGFLCLPFVILVWMATKPWLGGGAQVGSIVVLQTAAIGAERKLMFEVRCFRFLPLCGPSRELAATTLDAAPMQPLLRMHRLRFITAAVYRPPGASGGYSSLPPALLESVGRGEKRRIARIVAQFSCPVGQKLKEMR